MSIGTGTIQWRCGVCNSPKPVGTGGICSRCKKFACNRHLSTVLFNEKKIKVCSSCLICEDKVVKGIRGMFGRWLG
jgi:hypothetical protein